jgi:hypothetical protein
MRTTTVTEPAANVLDRHEKQAYRTIMECVREDGDRRGPLERVGPGTIRDGRHVKFIVRQYDQSPHNAGECIRIWTICEDRPTKPGWYTP